MRGGGARLGGGRGGGFFRGARPHGREWRPGRPAGYVVQWPMIFAIPDEDGAGAPYSYCLEGLDSDPSCAATYAGDERPDMSSPLQQRIHIAGNIFVTLTRSPEGVWSAETEIQTRSGPIVLRASADERVIRKAVSRLNRNQLFRLVHRAIHALPPEAREEEMVSGDIMGGFFDDVGNFFTKTIPKAVKSVAKSKVFQDISKGISEVANNPIVQGAMSIIPGGGLINEGMKHAGAAASLLARGKGGDQLARKGIQAIANAAASGNPKAQKALSLMQRMNANPLAFMPPGAGGGETAAAGWDPYRRPGSRAATNLMRRALQGDARAQSAVQQIARRADLGDLRARAAAETLASIAASNAAAAAAAQASAWAAQNPYAAPEVNPYGNPWANYAPASYPPSYVAPYGYPTTPWASVSVSGDPRGYPKCGSHVASGDDFPRPVAVDPAAYARMVKVYEAAGGDFFRRRPHPRNLHPLRGHSMHYGLPFRAH